MAEALENECIIRSCNECALGDRMVCGLLPDEVEALQGESLRVAVLQSCLRVIFNVVQLTIQRGPHQLPMLMHDSTHAPGSQVPMLFTCARSRMNP